MTTLPAGFTWDNAVALGQPEVLRLSDLAWPSYLLLESDMPEPAHQFRMSKAEFERRFPVWGIRSSDTAKLSGFAHGVLIEVDLQKRLPEDGWRFAIEAASRNTTPNVLCLVVASVDPAARGNGLAVKLIDRAKRHARECGFTQMIAPVRPTSKHLFPFESMETYLQRKTPEGEIYDSWLRIHVASGARIEGICHSSVQVQASLGKWREWTGLTLDTTGPVLVPQGLVPLEVDTNRNLGIYREPNVWVRYDV